MIVGEKTSEAGQGPGDGKCQGEDVQLAKFPAIPERHTEGSDGEAERGLAAPEFEKLCWRGFSGSPEE
jgi:hypothetical protein